MSSQNNHQLLYSASHSQIQNKLNVSTLIASLLILAAGIALLVVFSRQELSNSNFSTLLITGGVLLIFAAIVVFFMKNKRKVYAPTGSPVRNKSYYFNSEHLDEMSGLLTQADFQNAKTSVFKEDGNSRMDTIISDDSQFVAVQLAEYIPYAFQSATPAYYFNGEKALHFVDFLQKCNGKR